MRQDESARGSVSAAAYALGVLGAPAMGPMDATAQPIVTADVVCALSHQDAATRQVVARVAGRVFAPAPGRLGSGRRSATRSIAAMNDNDAAGAPVGDGLARLAAATTAPCRR